MSARALAPGERGATETISERRDAERKWKRVPPRSAERWRARCRYRGLDGIMRDLSRTGRTKVDALASLDAAFEEAATGSVDMTGATSLVEAGRMWLAHIALPASRLSERTVTDYGRTFDRYIDVDGSAVRGLTLAQANKPQPLRRFLQGIADAHGSGSAKVTRSVLTGILGLAVDNGALAASAIRQVGTVEASKTTKRARKVGVARDTKRAFTRPERDEVIAYADSLCDESPLLPQTLRKRQAVADLIAFMAGTGVRITEARRLRWDAVNLPTGRAEIVGTKSTSSHREVTLPAWLAERMRARAERVGTTGYVFASPHAVNTDVDAVGRIRNGVAPTRPQPIAGEVEWDQSNCAKAVADTLAGAGFGWATPHTFRRTVATLAAGAGAPLVDVADQLGHADPSMTARVYLGRSPFGERASVAQHL